MQNVPMLIGVHLTELNLGAKLFLRSAVTTLTQPRKRQRKTAERLLNILSG